MAHTKIQLWTNKRSPFGQRAWITLIEKKLSFELHFEKYASVSPNPGAPAKVPTLEDTNGKVVIESMDILKYLDDTYPDPALLSSKPDAMAKVNSFVSVVHINLFRQAFALGKATTRAELKEALPGLSKGLEVTNAALLDLGKTGSGDYFGGAQYTLADIGASPMAFWMVHLLKELRGVDVKALLKEQGLDRLSAWIEAVLSRPSFVATAPPLEDLVPLMARHFPPLADA